jgi:hypothetical protein
VKFSQLPTYLQDQVRNEIGVVDIILIHLHDMKPGSVARKSLQTILGTQVKVLQNIVAIFYPDIIRPTAYWAMPDYPLLPDLKVLLIRVVHKAVGTEALKDKQRAERVNVVLACVHTLIRGESLTEERLERACNFFQQLSELGHRAMEADTLEFEMETGT